jgi:hypothetical protein
MQTNPLPKVREIRQAIEQVQPIEIRNALKFQYLVCGRAKEVITLTTQGDKSGRNKPSGPTGEDVRLERFGEFDVALFNVYTQKRGDLKRIVALPLLYESWANELLDYFEGFGDNPVFPFTRQKLWATAKPYFENYHYRIDKYTIWKNKKLLKTVESHDKYFTLHALRHLRATELVEYYGFSGFDLSIYGGWTIQQSFGRYISLNWQSYIGKLLKKRTW